MTAPNREERRRAARADKASSASAFKKKDIVTLPSGNRVRIRRPGMVQFLESGFLPDPLAQLVREEISKRKGGTASKITEAELFKQLVSGEDMELIKEMMRAQDRVVAFCVLEPEVHWHERKSESGAYEEIPDTERDESIVYTDEIEEEDKRFLFQLVVGGTQDLERFREAASAVVGDLSPSGAVVKTAE